MPSFFQSNAIPNIKGPGIISWMTFAHRMLPMIIVVIFTRCGDRLTSPQSSHLSDVIHIVWTLQSHESDSGVVDVSAYAPFHLIYGKKMFFGDDGCNSYGGRYLTLMNRVIPLESWITEMACTHVKIYPVRHLAKPYAVEIDGNTLMVYSDTSIYTYNSDFTYAVNTCSFIDRDLILTSSNDTEFDSLQSKTFNSKLRFNNDKTFSIEIGWSVPYPYNSTNYSAHGVFGIGDNRAIMFYASGPSGKGAAAGEFAGKIFRSSSYCTEVNGLTLVDCEKDTWYRFTTE